MNLEKSAPKPFPSSNTKYASSARNWAASSGAIEEKELEQPGELRGQNGGRAAGGTLGKLLPGSVFITGKKTPSPIKAETCNGSSTRWDGTTNFLFQLPVFSVSVPQQEGNRLSMVRNQPAGGAARQETGAFLNGQPIRVNFNGRRWGKPARHRLSNMTTAACRNTSGAFEHFMRKQPGHSLLSAPPCRRYAFDDFRIRNQRLGGDCHPGSRRSGYGFYRRGGLFERQNHCRPAGDWKKDAGGVLGGLDGFDTLDVLEMPFRSQSPENGISCRSQNKYQTGLRRFSPSDLDTGFGRVCDASKSKCLNGCQLMVVDYFRIASDNFRPKHISPGWRPPLSTTRSVRSAQWYFYWTGPSSRSL